MHPTRESQAYEVVLVASNCTSSANNRMHRTAVPGWFHNGTSPAAAGDAERSAGEGTHIVHPMDLRELLEARDGRPTEYQAARKIATFAVIPAAMVGLLAGSQLVGIADPLERLLLVCTATASTSGFGIAFLVLGVYYVFGFRPVAVIADALVGVFYGLLCGGTLTLLLMWRKLVHHDHALWALLLIPLGTVVVPLFRAWRGKTRVRGVVKQAAASQTAEPTGEREPPTTRVLKS